MKLARRRMVCSGQRLPSTLSQCTNRFGPQLRVLITRDDGLLKGLDPEVVGVPQPHKGLAAQLHIDAIRAAQLLQHRVAGIGSERDAGHAPDCVSQAAVLRAAVGAPEEHYARGRQEDLLQGTVSLGFGQSEELPVSDEQSRHNMASRGFVLPP